MGLMDQTQALKWVQRNINAFGGDPGKVTLFGQSVGGISVTHHALLPTSRGLFKRIIALSGTALWREFYYDPRQSLNTTLSLAQSVGCPITPIDDTSNCLKSKSTNELVQSAKTNGLQFVVTIDEKFYPHAPLTLINDGFLDKSTEIVIGTTNADGFFDRSLPNTENFLVSNENYTSFIEKIVGDDSSAVEKVKKLYSNIQDSEKPANYRREVVALLTDIKEGCNAYRLSDLATINGNRVYKYFYTHVSSKSKLHPWQEVAHSYELYFIFGKPLIASNGYTYTDQKFAKLVMRYWSNFAKHGSPMGRKYENTQSDNLFKWPLYTLKEKETLLIDVKNEVLLKEESKRCSSLESFPTYDSTASYMH